MKIMNLIYIKKDNGNNSILLDNYIKFKKVFMNKLCEYKKNNYQILNTY